MWGGKSDRYKLVTTEGRSAVLGSRCRGLITNATDKSVNNEIVRNKMLLCFGTARVLSRAISYVLSNRAEKPVCAPGPCCTLEFAMWAKQIYMLPCSSRRHGVGRLLGL